MPPSLAPHCSESTMWMHIWGREGLQSLSTGSVIRGMFRARDSTMARSYDRKENETMKKKQIIFLLLLFINNTMKLFFTQSLIVRLMVKDPIYKIENGNLIQEIFETVL